MQIFFQILREKRQYHRSGTIDKRDEGQYPNFSRKPFKVTDVALKSSLKHLVIVNVPKLQSLVLVSC